MEALVLLSGAMLVAVGEPKSVQPRSTVVPNTAKGVAGNAPAEPAWAAVEASGLILFDEGRHSEAVEKLEASIALRPNDDISTAPTHVNLGIVWESIGLPISAIECYGRALSVDPQSAAAYQHMGGALETHFGERRMALDALRTAVALAPDRAASWNLLGTVLHSSGRLDEATDALAQAAALVPEDASMRRNWAALQRATGRFEEAVTVLREVAALTADGELETALAYDGLSNSECQGASSSEELGGSSDAGGGAGSECHTSGGSDSSSRVGQPSFEVLATADADALPVATPAQWRDVLRRVHLSAVADVAECQWAVATAEAHAKSLGGWDGSGHHDHYPTNDVVVAECVPLRQLLLIASDGF